MGKRRMEDGPDDEPSAIKTTSQDRRAKFKVHIDALNNQFGRWIDDQRAQGNSELWLDGTKDYVKHAERILREFSDVIEATMADRATGAAGTSSSVFGVSNGDFISAFNTRPSANAAPSQRPDSGPSGTTNNATTTSTPGGFGFGASSNAAPPTFGAATTTNNTSAAAATAATPASPKAGGGGGGGWAFGSPAPGGSPAPFSFGAASNTAAAPATQAAAASTPTFGAAATGAASGGGGGSGGLFGFGAAPAAASAAATAATGAAAGTSTSTGPATGFAFGAGGAGTGGFSFGGGASTAAAGGTDAAAGGAGGSGTGASPWAIGGTSGGAGGGGSGFFGFGGSQAAADKSGAADKTDTKANDAPAAATGTAAPAAGGFFNFTGAAPVQPTFPPTSGGFGGFNFGGNAGAAGNGLGSQATQGDGEGEEEEAPKVYTSEVKMNEDAASVLFQCQGKFYYWNPNKYDEKTKTTTPGWDSLGVGLFALRTPKDNPLKGFMTFTTEAGRVLFNASVYKTMKINMNNTEKLATCSWTANGWKPASVAEDAGGNSTNVMCQIGGTKATETRAAITGKENQAKFMEEVEKLKAAMP